MERLRFSNAERNQICFLVSNHHLFHDITEERIRWAIQQFGSEKLNQLKWMLRADILGKSPRCLHQLDELNYLYGTIGTMSAQMDQITPKDLAVTGSDLMALGLSGAQIGQALDALVNAVALGTLGKTVNFKRQSRRSRFKLTDEDQHILIDCLIGTQIFFNVNAESSDIGDPSAVDGRGTLGGKRSVPFRNFFLLFSQIVIEQNKIFKAFDFIV